MMEWLRSNFRTIWWVVVLVFFSLITLEIWTPILGFGDFRYIKSNIIIVFLVWIALLLWPLFKEINLFGFSLKKEIDSLKSEVKEQRLEFREQIVNLKSDRLLFQMIPQTVTITHPERVLVINVIGRIRRFR